MPSLKHFSLHRSYIFSMFKPASRYFLLLFCLTIMQINNRKGADMCNYFFFFFLRDFIMVVVFSLTVSFDNTRNFLLLFMDAINHLLRDCQSWKIKAFAHMKRILPFHKKVGATFLYSTWFLTRRRWWANTSFSVVSSL